MTRVVIRQKASAGTTQSSTPEFSKQSMHETGLVPAKIRTVKGGSNGPKDKDKGLEHKAEWRLSHLTATHPVRRKRRHTTHHRLVPTMVNGVRWQETKDGDKTREEGEEC